MDPKVKELMYSAGIDTKLSTLLVEFTGGDIEGAKKIVEAMPKEYIAIKIRYMAHKTHYYGAILIVVDIKGGNLEDIFIIVDKKTVASQIDNTMKYEDFKEKIIKYIKVQNPDQEIMGRFREIMGKEDFKEKIFDKLQENNEFDIEQLKLIFSELFSRILTERNCALKIETEGVDIFRIHESAHQYKIKRDDEKKEGGKEGSQKEEVHIRNISLVLLKAEPVVSPVMGVPANELQLNDEIMVKIIDEREIGDYLAKLLNGKENEELIPIPATIKEINKQEDTENLMIVVEFGPGIAGKMFISPEIKIEIHGLEDEIKFKKAGFFKISPLWIILILIILFLLFFIFTVFIGR